MSPPRINRINSSARPAMLLPATRLSALSVPNAHAPAPAKRPSRLLALKDRALYRSQLHAYRQARAWHHHGVLLQALGQAEPDPRAVKQAFRRFSANCRTWPLLADLTPVPASGGERRALHDALVRQREGIASVLPHLPERSHTALYLRLLDRQIKLGWARVETVVAYERHRDEVLARIDTAWVPKRLERAKISADGAGGAVLRGVQVKDPARTLAKGRTKRTQIESSESSRVGTSASELEEASDHAERSELSDVSFPGLSGPVPIERIDTAVAKGAPDFVAATPRRQSVRLEEVVKIERPEVAEATMRVYRTLDELACRASRNLPFDFGQHALAHPNEHLVQMLNTAEAAAERTHQQTQLHAAAQQGDWVVRQEPIDGVTVSKAPLQRRMEMLLDPSSCRSIGSTLVIAPLVGLHDHLSLDSCGFNNWSNLMLTPRGGLAVIDLAPTARTALDALSLQALQNLVDGLNRLARRVGPDGRLPADWRSALLDAMRDFWTTTFTATGGLFSDDDFLPPELLQERERVKRNTDALENALAQLDQRKAALPAGELSLQDIEALQALARSNLADQRARLKDIENTSIRASNRMLGSLRDAATPHLIRGIVDGIGWAISNAELLAQARAGAPDEEGGERPADAQTLQALRVLEGLSPKARQRLTRLKGVAPREAGMQRV